MELPSAMMIMLMLISTVNTLLHSSSPFSKETTEQASISTNNITSVILKSIINVSTTLPPPPSSSTTAKQMNTTILKWKQQSHQNIPTNVNNNNNNENNRNQKNSNVYRFDLPEDGKTQNVRKILSSSSTTTSTMEKNIQTSPASNSIINMPKRINYFGTQQQPNQQQHQPSSSLLNLDLKNKHIYGTKSTAKNTMTNVNQNDDKNWLLTKAWLIDNINRLRRELSELQRDYAKHIDEVHRDNLNNQKQLIEDVTKLKTDHQFLSQQQKQIIYLIKRSHYLKTKSNDFKLKLKMADAPVQQSLTNTKSTPTMELSEKLMKRPMVKRDISRRNKNQQFNHYEQQQQQNGEKFETETKRNMEEIFSELSALHDISLILFDDLKTLERKIDIRDKFLG